MDDELWCGQAENGANFQVKFILKVKIDPYTKQ